MHGTGVKIKKIEIKKNKLLMLFMNTSCDKFEVVVSNSFDFTVVHYTSLYFLYGVMMA
jgi:hypothetical protein